MRINPVIALAAAALALAACEHRTVVVTPVETNVVNIIAPGGEPIEVAPQAQDVYTRPDGTVCQVYAFRQEANYAPRTGKATICQRFDGSWVLVEKTWQDRPWQNPDDRRPHHEEPPYQPPRHPAGDWQPITQ